MFENIKLILDKYHWKIKRRVALFTFNFFEFFDKSPQLNKGENLINYSLRVEKKYALRRLNFNIKIMRDNNLDAIDEFVKVEEDEFKKDLLQYMRKMMLNKIIYLYLRDKIKKS